MSLERLARKSPLRKRLHQFGAIEQLHQLGDRFLRRRMFSGDVARDDRLRLEDRIDENVVAHDPLVPHGVNGPRTATAPRYASSYHTAFAQRVLTPSVVGATRRVTAETDVEAGAHDALGLVDIDQCGTQADDLRRERDLAGAEIVIIIFDETGEDVGEGIFTADTDGPSRAHLARRIRGAEDDRGRPIFVALPRRTAPDVAEQAIPGVADAAGHARQRPDLAVIGDADLAGAVVAALGIGPGIVALDADHKAAGKLVVAAGLRAAKPAVQRVFAERLAVKRAAGRAHDPVLRLRPQTAGMAADVAAAPAPNRNDRRRLMDGKAHVGRDRRTRQCDQRGRCEQEFPHHLAPAMRGAVCNAWTWNTVADAPHPRGFAQRRWRLSATHPHASPAGVTTQVGFTRLAH